MEVKKNSIALETSDDLRRSHIISLRKQNFDQHPVQQLRKVSLDPKLRIEPN